MLDVREHLQLSQEQVGEMIGVDRTTISKLRVQGILDLESKPGELVIILVRIYRILYVLVDSESQAMRHWLFTYNHHLESAPLVLMAKAEGLVSVVQYLDVIRVKV